MCKSNSGAEISCLSLRSLTKLLGFGISFSFAISSTLILLIESIKLLESFILINSLTKNVIVNPSSVSTKICSSLTDSTTPFIASSSTETLSPLLNIFVFFILIFTWYLGTQLHHSHHKNYDCNHHYIHIFFTTPLLIQSNNYGYNHYWNYNFFHLFSYQFPKVLNLKLHQFIISTVSYFFVKLYKQKPLDLEKYMIP